MRRSSRQRGQSIVEFGIIAILFTLIMFAIADFGLLLNSWLSVSSGARLLARDAAVGMTQADLVLEASSLPITGVTADPYFGSSYCCTAGTPGSALQLRVVYYNHCTPQVLACAPVDTALLDSRYTSGGAPGMCHSWEAPPVGTNTPCAHPSPPKLGACAPSLTCPGDTVVLTLTAAGAQVITPLVRPFFTNSTTCQSNSAHCYVALSSSVAMRFEGDTL